MRLFILLAACLCCGILNAAGVFLWGPVMGVTTAHSIRIVFKTTAYGNLNAVFFEGRVNSGAANVQFTEDSSIVNNGFIRHIRVAGLKAATAYSFYIIVNGDTLQGGFNTFPEESSRQPFTFTFGSCNENYKDQSIFAQMDAHRPLFFLHLGDWTYPDHEPYPWGESNGKNRLYSASYDTALAAYNIRYTLPYMKSFMQHTPMDFVYDDDDMTIDGCSRTTYTELTMVNKRCEMIEHPLADSIRMNTINSYFAAFPAFPMQHAAQDGAYHSYRCGNTEIFFLDTRANRSPDTEIFKPRKKGKWRLKVQPGHNNLGQAQYQWLLNGLKQSTADWKIIASGTNFNPGYKKVLDLCLFIQSHMLPNGMNGAYVGAMLSSTWSGYPYQQRGLLNYCNKNKIANVVMLSGDAHTAAIDNGKNSGFPECMSGNLAVDNTKQLDYVHNVFQFNIWNEGGQGLGNYNYQNTFGKVEVFGADSLRFSIIDDKGAELTRYTVKKGFIPRHFSMRQGTRLTAAGKLRSLGKIFKMLSKRKAIEKAHPKETAKN